MCTSRCDPEWIAIEIDGLLSVLEATDQDGRVGALEWAAVVVLPALRTNVDKLRTVLKEISRSKLGAEGAAMTAGAMSLRERLAEAEAHLAARPPGDAGAVALRVWHDRRADLLHAIGDRQPRRQPDRLALAGFALRLLRAGAEPDVVADRVALAALAGLDAELDRLDLAALL